MILVDANILMYAEPQDDAEAALAQAETAPAAPSTPPAKQEEE